MLREGYDGNVNDVSNQPAAKPPAESSSESTESSRFTRGDSTLTTVGRIVMVYAVVQLLMAISALASLSGLDPAASVQVIGGWRIGLRVHGSRSAWCSRAIACCICSADGSAAGPERTRPNPGRSWH